MVYSKEQRIVNQMRGYTSKQATNRGEERTPIATGMYLPNHSGITSHPEFERRVKVREFSILDPYSVYSTDTQMFLGKVKRTIEITSIEIELSVPTNEVLGDLKYADSLQGLENPVVINDFDTTSGKRIDTSITNAIVPEGKAIYLQFDSQPNSAITQMFVRIEYR